MSCRRFLVLQKHLKYGCNFKQFAVSPRTPYPPTHAHLVTYHPPPNLLTRSNTTSAPTILLYQNTQSQTKFFSVIFIMSGVQLIFWAYLSYFAFAELRQETLCHQADQATPTLQEATPTLQEGTPTSSMIKEPVKVPWYSSLKWRLAISLMALGVGVFFATTACMYPLRVVQTLSYIRGKGGGVSITTYSPTKGTRDVRVELGDIRVAGSRVAEGKGRQLGMKVKGHRLFYLLDREGDFPNPKIFDTLIGARRM